MSTVTCEPICQWCGEPIAVNEPSCMIHGMPCHIGCDDKVIGCEVPR